MSTAAGSAIKPIDFSPRAETPAKRDAHSRSIAEAVASHGLLLVHCGAFVLALIAAAECHSVVTRSAPQVSRLPSLLYGLVLWYWWGIIATAIWKLAGTSGKHFFSLASASKHALAGVLLSAAHLWLLQRTVDWLILRWPVLGPAGYSSLDYLNFNRFCFELLLYGFIFGMTGVIRLQVAAQRDAMRALSLEKELSVAHLRALQMQIEPHFLFNTLNAITSLVELDRKEHALQTLGHLNSILKSTLRRSTPEKVALAQELELVDDYLSIEETRFSDRLEIDMTIDPATLDGRVPCFLLQPIIENAIRHGIARCETSGVVRVSAGRQGSRLQITVRDTGPGTKKPTQPGHGIGLKNTRERLAHFYGGDFEFRAAAMDSGGFEVFIDIPYERREA
jgi:signal transduction histidine kinase